VGVSSREFPDSPAGLLESWRAYPSLGGLTGALPVPPQSGQERALRACNRIFPSRPTIDAVARRAVVNRAVLLTVSRLCERGYRCVLRTTAGWRDGLIRFTGWKTISCPGEFPNGRSRAPAFWRIAKESAASKSCWSTPAARTGARRTTVPGRSRKARSTRRKIQSRPPAASSPKN
jgi:hypothetical protein